MTGMSETELRRMVEEIEEVAKVIFEALPSTTITVGESWETLSDAEREGLGKLAAAAIDRRDEQLRRAPTFHLGVAEVKLLTGDLSDHDGDAEAGMAAMLPLDQRMRDWLAVEHDPAAEPRPLRVLLLEAPEGAEPAEVEPGEAVQGSMELLADADEAYVFRGDRVVALKHRDREPEDVHVAIQRRSS